MVGRPKEFAEDVALERAMEVFWTHGYEATSVQDLLDAMEINRGSLYDTFGDKQELFLKAVQHYGQMIMARASAVLDGPGSPIGNVRKLVRMWGQMACGEDCFEPCRGCLLCNTAVELAPHDPRVGQLIQAMMQSLESALHKALQRAKDCGELSDRSSPRALARFLTNTVQGLAVMCRANASRSTVKDIMNVTLTTLE